MAYRDTCVRSRSHEFPSNISMAADKYGELWRSMNSMALPTVLDHEARTQSIPREGSILRLSTVVTSKLQREPSLATRQTPFQSRDLCDLRHRRTTHRAGCRPLRAIPPTMEHVCRALQQYTRRARHLFPARARAVGPVVARRLHPLPRCLSCNRADPCRAAR